MKQRLAVPKMMIMDACVLIDFLKTDPSVLSLIAEHVGPVYVVSTIVEEVNQVGNDEELIELGLIIVEPEMEDAYVAIEATGPTSFQDRLCLLTAKRYGFLCVTNDVNLRKVCKQEGVLCYWGLQLLAELHKAGGISGRDAETIARAIHESNPKHITAKIISSFTNIIERQETLRSRT